MDTSYGGKHKLKQQGQAQLGGITGFLQDWELWDLPISDAVLAPVFPSLSLHVSAGKTDLCSNGFALPSLHHIPNPHS